MSLCCLGGWRGLALHPVSGECSAWLVEHHQAICVVVMTRIRKMKERNGGSKNSADQYHGGPNHNKPIFVLENYCR